MTTAHLFS